MKNIVASIITIGDELLIGQVIDTNSAFIAQQLNSIGIPVKKRVSVGDAWNDIWNALDEECKSSDIIILTGGLGPTLDDITKPLLCKYFNGNMIVNEIALENVKSIFAKYTNRPLLKANIKQAEVPDVCTVIQNTQGTAPGMLFEKNDTIVISIPGVPHEMQTMMTEYIVPKLKSSFGLPPVAHKTLLTCGIGESYLEEKINDFETALPASIKLAYLPNYGMVRLRLSGIAGIKDNNLSSANDLNVEFEKLKNLVKEFLVCDEDISMQEVVGRMLMQQNKTLATAESCTGGYIAHLITSVAGSSKYFYGSVVSYDNSVKQNMLQVKEETLTKFGAVSEETVREMTSGALQNIKTDYAIAVSGIMGPDGGTEEKPVGTVWVAAGNKNKISAKKYHFRFDRKRNIELTAITALNHLRVFILENSRY